MQSRLGNKNPSRFIGGAIVSPTPGTTRDRRECIGRIGNVKFKLLDTAGLDGEKIGHYTDGMCALKVILHCLILLLLIISIPFF